MGHGSAARRLLAIATRSAAPLSGRWEGGGEEEQGRAMRPRRAQRGYPAASRHPAAHHPVAQRHSPRLLPPLSLYCLSPALLRAFAIATRSAAPYSREARKVGREEEEKWGAARQLAAPWLSRRARPLPYQGDGRGEARRNRGGPSAPAGARSARTRRPAAIPQPTTPSRSDTLLASCLPSPSTASLLLSCGLWRSRRARPLPTPGKRGRLEGRKKKRKWGTARRLAGSCLSRRARLPYQGDGRGEARRNRAGQAAPARAARGPGGQPPSRSPLPRRAATLSSPPISPLPALPTFGDRSP